VIGYCGSGQAKLHSDRPCNERANLRSRTGLFPKTIAPVRCSRAGLLFGSPGGVRIADAFPVPPLCILHTGEQQRATSAPVETGGRVANRQ